MTFKIWDVLARTNVSNHLNSFKFIWYSRPGRFEKWMGKKKKRCVCCALLFDCLSREVWREGYYQTKYNTPSNKHTVSQSVHSSENCESEREREREWPASCYIVVSIITRNRNRTAGRSVSFLSCGWWTAFPSNATWPFMESTPKNYP